LVPGERKELTGQILFFQHFLLLLAVVMAVMALLQAVVEAPTNLVTEVALAVALGHMEPAQQAVALALLVKVMLVV
jgi:hypothetical protein